MEFIHPPLQSGSGDLYQPMGGNEFLFKAGTRDYKTAGVPASSGVFPRVVGTRAFKTTLEVKVSNCAASVQVEANA